MAIDNETRNNEIEQKEAASFIFLLSFRENGGGKKNERSLKIIESNRIEEEMFSFLLLVNSISMVQSIDCIFNCARLATDSKIE